MASTIDVSSLVPSTRDFLQAIATRRKRLALVPLVDSAEDATRLVAAGVSAIAVSAPGDSMRAVSEAIGGTPLLSLLPIASDEDALVARTSGADAVIVDAQFEGEAWVALARGARSTRMAVLAMATDVESARRAASIGALGAKGIFLRLGAQAGLAAAAALLVAPLRVIAHVPGVDETALRGMKGEVDAVIVESDLYLSTSFETLKDELDP